MLQSREIEHILSLSQESNPHHSLAQGNAGNFALFLEAFFLSGKSIFQAFALKELREGIFRERNFPKNLPMLFGGSGSTLWALKTAQRLIPEKLTDDELEFSHRLQQKLVSGSKEYLSKQGRFELLYGALGICLLGRTTGDKELTSLGDNFLKDCLVSGNWSSPENTENIIKEDFSCSEKINLGIAHGISGVLLYGARLVRRKEDPSFGEALIGSLRPMILEFEKTKVTRYLPSFAPDVNEPRQQGWCYGDPGIGYALMQSDLSNSRNGEEIFRRGVEAFRSQHRENSLCHGWASILLMERNSGLTVTDLEYDYLLSGEENRPGLLTGVAGELLTRFSLRKTPVTGWDQLLFLDKYEE